MKVILPSWSKIINETFIPLISNEDRYLICWGGRGSSKSIFAAKKLIYRCLCEPYFRYILYRRTYNTIKDSQFQTIKDIVYDWGLQDLFVFNTSPLEIRCVNGNKFICRGGDEPKKLKSVKDPTGVWYEEEIPDEGDFITITTSIRTTKAKYLQEIFTINPEVEGDYQDHWFWKQYFKDKPDGTFSDRTVIDIGDGKTFEMTYTSHHSTYLDNRWIPDSFIAQLNKLRADNPYYYTIYALGRWGNKTTGGLFWKHFNRAYHVGKTQYNPDIALHLSFDFNVNPYMTLTVWQVVGKEVYLIDEICLPSPKNTTSGVCREFTGRYANHKAGLFVYGDPSGKKEDTRSEKGHNDFMIIRTDLAGFKPQMRVLTQAPPVVMSAQWLNSVFHRNEGGLKVLIGDRCNKAIDDFQYVKEAADGTMHKGKVKDKETEVTYEKYGHISDAFRYFMCYAFAADFAKYQAGGLVKVPSYGKNTASKNSY
jgi:PBSX family phage terminase large subunit